MVHPHRFLGIGLAVAAIYWMAEAAIETWIFGLQSGWAKDLVPDTGHEWWMRGLAVILIVTLGAHTDRERRAILKAAEDHRVVVQSQLDDALTRVLDDFLPICSHCKAIRRGDQWVPLESYVTKQTKSQFSHGLCPTCVVLYDESP